METSISYNQYDQFLYDASFYLKFSPNRQMKVSFSIKIKDNFRIKGQRRNWDENNM